MQPFLSYEEIYVVIISTQMWHMSSQMAYPLDMSFCEKKEIFKYKSNKND